MTDLAFVFIGILQGAVIGLVGYDLARRASDKKDLSDAKQELQKTQAALAELHNKNQESMRILQDKVNAHAMALTTGFKLK